MPPSSFVSFLCKTELYASRVPLAIRHLFAAVAPSGTGRGAATPPRSHADDAEDATPPPSRRRRPLDLRVFCRASGISAARRAASCEAVTPYSCQMISRRQVAFPLCASLYFEASPLMPTMMRRGRQEFRAWPTSSTRSATRRQRCMSAVYDDSPRGDKPASAACPCSARDYMPASSSLARRRRRVISPTFIATPRRAGRDKRSIEAVTGVEMAYFRASRTMVSAAILRSRGEADAYRPMTISVIYASPAKCLSLSFWRLHATFIRAQHGLRAYADAAPLRPTTEYHRHGRLLSTRLSL